MDYKTCMENRPMKPANQQKKIYDKYFKSDILNEKSGYFKSEKIFKITPKPNESRPINKEYVPKYNAIIPKERRQFDLMDADQKVNLKLNQLNLNNNNINSKRKYKQIIKENCYDDKGIFSARKRYLLEFYGMEQNQNYEQKMNKTLRHFNKVNKLENDYSKDDNKSRVVSETKRNYNTIKTTRNKKPLEKFRKYFTSVKPLKKKSEEDFVDINCQKKQEKKKPMQGFTPKTCSSVEKFPDSGAHRKNTSNFFRNINYLHDFNTANNNYYNNNDPDKINLKKNMTKNKIKRDLSTKINTKNDDKQKQTIDSYRNANFKKYKKRITNADKNNDNKNYYNIEITNKKSLKNNNNPLYDIKSVKEIFYNNGIHAYDIRNDSIENVFSDENKINLKIRKDKDDSLFDENYEKAVLQLNKLKADIKKCEIDDIKYTKKKKRQGTPGTELKRRNKEDFEEEKEERKEKMNKAKNGSIHKRKRDIMPVNNCGYKNNYYYQHNFFKYKKV